MRVRQLKVRVNREFLCMCVCVCVLLCVSGGVEEGKEGLFFVLVSLHNSTPCSVCVHLHRMI